jgi:hypothetical protein
MMPRIARGAVLLLDRHYNSLKQYHRGTPNITMRHSLCSSRLGTRDLAAAPYGMADGAGRDRHGQKLRRVIIGRVGHVAFAV